MSYSTKKSLLEAIQRGDEVSWHEFYETYSPLICFRGKDYNLSKSEIDDLIQTVMLRFFNKQKNFVYDRSKGRFRDYLSVMIHNCIVDIIRKRPTQEVTMEEDMDWADDKNLHDLWEEEWRHHIMNQAVLLLRDQVEDRTFQAFDLYVINGTEASQVAKFLDIPVQSLYDIKNRLTKMLRKIVAELLEK